MSTESSRINVKNKQSRIIYPSDCHGLATVDEQTNSNLDEDVAHAADWILAAKKWLKIVFAD